MILGYYEFWDKRISKYKKTKNYIFFTIYEQDFSLLNVNILKRHIFKNILLL